MQRMNTSNIWQKIQQDIAAWAAQVSATECCNTSLYFRVAVQYLSRIFLLEVFVLGCCFPFLQ